jgi:hypothetical protein
MAGQNGKIRVALSALADALRRAGVTADIVISADGSALIASDRRSKVSYVVPGSEDIDLK